MPFTTQQIKKKKPITWYNYYWYLLQFLLYFFPSLWSQIPVFTTLPPNEICNHLIIQWEDVIRMGGRELHFYWVSITSDTQPDAQNLLLNINTLFVSVCQNYLCRTQKQEINFSNRKVGLLNKYFNFHFDEKHWRTTRSETVSAIRYKESYSEISIFLVKQRRVFIKINLHKLLAEQIVLHYRLWK